MTLEPRSPNRCVWAPAARFGTARGRTVKAARPRFRPLAALAAAIVIASATGARAQNVPLGGMPPQAGVPSSAMPPMLREVGFDQRLNERVPLDIPLRDEHGRTVRLGDFFGRRPVVLTLVYYECPMLCTQVLNSLVAALTVLTLDPGRDFELVTVSFDPRETPTLASAKKTTYIERYRRAGADTAWHFLTGDQASITRLTEAIGFRYVYDRDIRQFAHPSGITVLTPDGRLSHYLYGIEYGPRDLRFALIDASAGKVGNPVDKLLLYCYHYDPATGRYGFVVMTIVRAAGVVTVLAIVSFIVVMRRRETRATDSPRRARDYEPRVPSPEPRTPSPGPRAPNPEPRTPGPEPRAPNPEPRTPNPEPRTPGPGPRAPSPEPRTPSPEPR